MNMSPSERDNYQTLKAKLIESEETNLKHSAHSFWTLPKDKGMSIRDYGHKLYRLLKRFAGDPDPEVVLQKVLRERIIQILPKDARAFVRNRDPETVAKACCLAEQYFSNEESDLTAWDSRSNDENRPLSRHHPQEKSNNYPQYNKWQKKSQDHDSKPPSSPKKSQETRSIVEARDGEEVETGGGTAQGTPETPKTPWRRSRWRRQCARSARGQATSPLTAQGGSTRYQTSVVTATIPTTSAGR